MRLLALFFLFGFTFAAMAESDANHQELGRYLGAKETVYPDWFKTSFLDFSEDVAEAAEQGKRVLMVFHQDNCPYCNALVEQNLSQKNIEEKLKADFDVISMNMWGDREVATVDGKTYTEKSFAAALNVQFTPTILILDEQGALALRLNGYLPPTQFKLALDYASDSTEGNKGYRQYLAAHHTDQREGRLIKEPFFDTSKPDLASQGKPLAVFFEQKDCPQCERLHQQVLKEQDSIKEIGKFKNIQLDMWGAQKIKQLDGSLTTARDLATALNIKYAPTIVLFDKNGHEVIRSEAMFKTFHTQSMFDYVSSGDYKNQPNFQRYISERAERIRETGKDVDIWK